MEIKIMFFGIPTFVFLLVIAVGFLLNISNFRGSNNVERNNLISAILGRYCLIAFFIAVGVGVLISQII